MKKKLLLVVSPNKISINFRFFHDLQCFFVYFTKRKRLFYVYWSEDHTLPKFIKVRKDENNVNNNILERQFKLRGSSDEGNNTISMEN